MDTTWRFPGGANIWILHSCISAFCWVGWFYFSLFSLKCSQVPHAMWLLLICIPDLIHSSALI